MVKPVQTTNEFDIAAVYAREILGTITRHHAKEGDDASIPVRTFATMVMMASHMLTDDITHQFDAHAADVEKARAKEPFDMVRVDFSAVMREFMQQVGLVTATMLSKRPSFHADHMLIGGLPVPDDAPANAKIMNARISLGGDDNE